jgi:hypothetical protein
MSKLAEYFHKKYYSDLPFEQVNSAIYGNQDRFNAAVNHVHQLHYSDLDPGIIASNFSEKPQTTNSIKVENPFTTRSYASKSPESWTPQDYREYLFDKDNGFTDNSMYGSWKQNYENSVAQKIFSRSSRTYNKNIEDVYFNQTLPNGEKVDKKSPFYDKNPSYEKLTPERINEMKKNVEDNTFMYREDEEWNKLGTTKDKAIYDRMIVQPKQDYLNYLDNPQYIEIAKKTYGPDWEKAIEAQKERIRGVDIKFGEMEPGTKGTYLNGVLNLDKPTFYPVGPSLFAPTHELSHATDDGLKAYSYNVETTRANTPPDIQKLGSIWSDFIKNKSISIQNAENSDDVYLNNPTEVRARINSIRQDLLKNNVNLNSDDEALDKVITERQNGDFQYKQLKKVLKKEDIFKAMRELAVNDKNQIPSQFMV